MKAENITPMQPMAIMVLRNSIQIESTEKTMIWNTSKSGTKRMDGVPSNLKLMTRRKKKNQKKNGKMRRRKKKNQKKNGKMRRRKRKNQKKNGKMRRRRKRNLKTNRRKLKRRKNGKMRKKMSGVRLKRRGRKNKI